MKRENNFFQGVILLIVVVIVYLLISRFKSDGATKFQTEQYEKYEQIAYADKYGYGSIEDAADALYVYMDESDSDKARNAMDYIYDYVEGVGQLMTDPR